MVTAVIIALLGSAYFWGKPIIDKRTTIVEFTTGKDFILQLDRKIIDITNAGGGSFELDIPSNLRGASLKIFSVNVSNPLNNSIVFEFFVSQPILDIVRNNTNLIPVETSNLEEVGVYGQDDPRTINLQGQAKGSDSILTFILHYRELDTQTVPQEGFKIGLKAPGDIFFGKRRIIVTYEKEEVLPSIKADNGGPLTMSWVVINAV